MKLTVRTWKLITDALEEGLFPFKVGLFFLKKKNWLFSFTVAIPVILGERVGAKEPLESSKSEGS